MSRSRSRKKPIGRIPDKTPPKKTRTLVLANITFASLILAQQPSKLLDPPELVATKAEHVRAMNRAEIALLTNYLQALASLRRQYVVQAKTEAIAAVDAAIKSAQADFDAANEGSNITTAAATQLQIEQAVYGDLQRNRVGDVTNYIKSALTSGQPTVSIYGANMLQGDPAPGIRKFLRITYTVDGKRKFKDFKEGPDLVLDFKKDLR